MEVRVAKLPDKRAIDQRVDVRKNLAQTFVCHDFLVCESGIAPDVLSGLLLYAACQLRKGFYLIERVTSGEGDIREFVGLHDLKEIVDRHLPSPLEIP